MVNRGVNPVLIGSDLHYLCEAEDIRAQGNRSYLVLVLGFDGDGGRYSKPFDHSTRKELEFFFSSLQNHTILERSREIFFPDIGLTLNYYDLFSFHTTYISAPYQLVTHAGRDLQSAYMYWEDNSFAVRKIKSEHITGMLEPGSAQPILWNIVVLTWAHLPSKKLRQHIFHSAGIIEKVKQIDNGKRGEGFNITGFKWK
jgi:hypothetical protein